MYLVVDEDRYSEVDAHYVPDADVAFARLSEPKNYRTGPDPAGRTVLCAEVPATAGDATWSADDAELGDLVVDGMRRIGLRIPTVGAVAVRRLPRVYPVLDGRRRRPRTPRWPGATRSTASPCSAARACTSPTTCTTCWTWRWPPSAASTGDGGWDAPRWAAERRRFEAFVVDD